MAKYRKKPVVIDAVQFDRRDSQLRKLIWTSKESVVIDAVQFDPHSSPWPDGIISWEKEVFQPRDMSWGYIQTLEGRMHVIAGDWIITGVAGERYPCKDVIFCQTYERVEE